MRYYNWMIPEMIQWLKKECEGIRERARQCEMMSRNVVPGPGSERDIGRLSGKALAYTHSAFLVEQVVGLFESATTEDQPDE